MKIWSKDQLVASLKKEGLVFTDFSLVHEGQYAVDDADWNYKDVPHLHHVHELVEANFAVMDDKVINTINTQKILGIKLPLVVVNYESGKDEQTYYTCFLFFALIIQTKYTKLSDTMTRVISNYSIGGPRLLKWCFPLIKFLIKKNYDNLMTADIPMRTRRGALRALGYRFIKEDERYSFKKTTEILKQNVLPPVNISALPAESISINHALPGDGEVRYGQDDHMGLRLVRQADRLMVFGRMCLHEGASLDKSSCHDGKLKCPWHGRLHAPLAAFDLANTAAQKQSSQYFTFELNGDGILSIKNNTSHVESGIELACSVAT